MEEFLTFLNAIRPLSESLSEHFTKTLKIKQIKKRSFLVRAGQVNNHFFFIVNGLIRGYYVKQNREISIWFLKENDFIASIESYVTQQPSKETMQALEDCTVVYGSFADLDNTYLRFPELERHGRLITQKYSSLWYSLLYGIRMQTATQRYQFLIDKFPELLLRVPAKYLASYLSITEVTLSRIRSKR